jgi:acyl carrier protein
MSTLERVQTILSAHYPVQPQALTLDARLEQLEIDSLGIMELFFAIEDEFGITVPNDKRSMHTVGDLVAYIDELLAQQGVPAASGQSEAIAPDAGRAAL